MSAHCLFGIELHADVALPGGAPSVAAGWPAVALRRADPGVLMDPPPAGGSWRTRIDGRTLTAGHLDGRLAVAWGEDCRFELDPAARVLRWSARDPRDPGWQRLLLDTVAYLVALESGREALHAGAVALPGGGALAFAAASGAGKSTLAGALLAAGAEIVADDVVALEATADAILAYPGPPLMNVPAERPLPDGDVLAAFGDERWTQVAVVEGPRALEALVLLERRAGAEEVCERVERPMLAVLAALLAFPRTRERERRRFELAAELASRVPVLRLVADMGTAPERLAERVLERVGGVHA